MTAAMGDLFQPEGRNLLPFDGEAIDYGPIVSAGASHALLHRLMEAVPWQHDEVVMFGKRIVTARQVAWYADDGISYRYSGSTKEGLAWIPELRELKELSEARSGEFFNSCLLNLYADGSQSMGWHSDDESSIVRDSAIASLSFGAARKFAFKHKENPEAKVSIVLESGSLLVMKGGTQRCWLHALPKMARVKEPRVNLTFRRMIG